MLTFAAIKCGVVGFTITLVALSVTVGPEGVMLIANVTFPEKLSMLVTFS